VAEPLPDLLPGQRALFDIPDDVAYFNCASLSPQMLSVRRAGEEMLARLGHPWTIRSRDWFTGAEELRALFAKIVGAGAESVALIPATSYGIAVAAANTEAKRGDRIVLLAEDYPSNVYTWRAFAERTGAEIVTVASADAVAGAIDERVRVVAVPYVRWTNGELLDLERIGEAARAVNAMFIVDATQACGAMPVDVTRIRPDFLVSSGYKWLLGPFSSGYMYVDERHHGGKPIEQNWIAREGSEDFARLVDYRDAYQPGARRFDVGQRANFALAAMGIAALTQILEWDVARISRTLGAITTDIERRAAALGIPVAEGRAPHIVGLKPSAPLKAIAKAMEANNVYVGIRADTMRVSPHLHTSAADVDRLFEALTEAL
jgi:selenocysteine lyase/cysteine desulfurase